MRRERCALAPLDGRAPGIWWRNVSVVLIFLGQRLIFFRYVRIFPLIALALFVIPFGLLLASLYVSVGFFLLLPLSLLGAFRWPRETAVERNLEGLWRRENRAEKKERLVL